VITIPTLKFWKWFRTNTPKTEIEETFGKYGRLGRAQIFIEVIDKERVELIPAKVFKDNDHYLSFNYRGAKKKVLITPGIWPKVFEASKWFGFKKFRALVFHAGATSEATHDPAASQLDVVALESMMKLGRSIIETDVLDAMAKAAEGKKGWVEYIPYFVIALIVFLFLFAFEIQPNM